MNPTANRPFAALFAALVAAALWLPTLAMPSAPADLAAAPAAQTIELA